MTLRIKCMAAMAALMVVLAGVAMAAKSQAKKSAMGCGMDCPLCIPGAHIEVQKIESGVVINVTAQDPALVKRIQDLAMTLPRRDHAKAPAAADVYRCPMGDYTGPMTKDGRCPSCGMNLEKVQR